MPSASSCFLMSFCFRKASRESFSESAKNLRKLCLHGNKDYARRRPAGAPHAPDAPRRGPGWAAAGLHLAASGTFSRRPFAYKFYSSRKPSGRRTYFQKTSEAAAVANPNSGGIWSSSRHPAGGGDHHRRHLHHHSCLRSDAWVVHHGTTGPCQ